MDSSYPHISTSSSSSVPLLLRPLDDTNGITSQQPNARQQLQQQLLRKIQSSSQQTTRLKVFIFPLHLPSLIFGEGKHFMLDGVLRSSHLELIWNISNPNSADVWLANFRIGYRPKHWCHVLMDKFQKNNNEKNNLPALFLLDWSDHPILNSCPNWTTSISNQLHYLKRSIVINRDFNETTSFLNWWVELGSIDTFSDWSTYSASPVYNLPYAVRSDLVSTMEQIVGMNTTTATTDSSDTNSKNKNNSYIQNVVHFRDRPIDVAHFWPSPPNHIPLEQGGRLQGVDRGGKLHNNAKLRDLVSMVLDGLNNTSTTTTGGGGEKIHVRTGLVGKAGDKGRNGVEMEYAQQLLDTKIIVVAQKDHWEGHYRLMEALVSGACVLSDVMLSIPPIYQDGIDIVFYNSRDDLVRKILYYLDHPVQRKAIAQRGLEITLQRCRSWHLMEEVIFGKPMY
eukprot:scaffold8114_cov126-Cylindrotheca_fusiformis.AAC.18